MIKPEEIPEFTGDLEQLEKDYGSLKKDAGQIRSTGADVHTQFQGLSAYYKAPEADQLFASTKPVSDRADTFGTDLETVSSALSGYAAEIRPLVAKLKQLKHDAQTFVDSVEGDDDWQYDEDKVKKNNQLRDDVTATVAAFWAAERTCHNKITALWHGTQMIAGDGTDKKNMYGYSASDLKGAKGLPWGDPVEQKHHWYDVGHWVKSFVWDGIVVDGIWGTVKGLGTLVGVDGWDAMKTAWKGLAQLATGLAFMSNPVLAVAFWATPDKYMPSWLRESRNTMKQTGKALLAWDEWGKNPARAAGGVTFNVLTAVFTDGAGAAAEGAGKAGAVAKAISFAGKAGRVIDPMTYVMKGAGAGLSKIGDISKALKGAGKIDIPRLPDNAITLPEGTVHLPDGTVRLPEGAPLPKDAVRLPDGSVRLPHDAPLHPAGTDPLHTPEGEPPLVADEHGNIVDHKGDVLLHHDGGPPDITNRPPSDSDLPHTPSPAKQPVLAGTGVHGADTTAHAGEHIKLGDSTDHDLGDTGRAGDETPAVHAGGDIPAAHTEGDLPGNAAGDHLEGDHAGDRPPGGVHEHRADAAAGQEPPFGHSNDHQGAAVVSHDDIAGDHPGPHGGDHSHGHAPDGGADIPTAPHDAGFGGPVSDVPDGPRGDLPDGSWTGENGLHLDTEANRAVDEFMDRSRAAEPGITESMRSIVGRNDGKLIGLEYRLKGEDSLKRKIATDMLENIGRRHGDVLGGIKDSIRYTMEVPAGHYTEGVQHTIEELRAKGFENVTFKNTWDSAGYKGINSTWRDPVSGQVFELQFHTADSFTAKMDGHALYEKERLPGVTPKELAAIKTEQADLFGRVPVPHGAGDIRIGAHGAADTGSLLGKDGNPAVSHVDHSAYDPHGPPHDAPREHELPAPADTTEAAQHGAGAHEHGHVPGDSPYTEGPHGGWSGAGWVEKPDPIHDPDSVVAAEMYEEIRSADNKVELPALAKHTGVDESVLRQVKSHLFRAQHEVAIGPGAFKKGLFTPRRDVGELWFAAREGKLSEEGVQQFKHLMAHEYVESRLMKSGLPYIREYDHLWELDPSDGKYYRPQFPQDIRDAGAHDLAPNDKIGGFRHWRSLGMEKPGVELADDLSNLDEVVKAIHQQLRLKGLDL